MYLITIFSNLSMDVTTGVVDVDKIMIKPFYEVGLVHLTSTH